MPFCVVFWKIGNGKETCFICFMKLQVISKKMKVISYTTLVEQIAIATKHILNGYELV